MSSPNHPIRRQDRALDEAEKREALQALGLRFAPDHADVVDREVGKDLFRTAVVRIRIERATGKARR